MISTSPPKVDAAETFTLSNSVCPSTSRSPLASILLANVAIPVTFKVSLMLVISSSVLPSTSRSALISTLEAKVDTPDTFKLSSSVCPSTSKSPLASMAPDTVSAVSVPKFVSDELTTPDPKVVALNTSV